MTEQQAREAERKAVVEWLRDRSARALNDEDVGVLSVWSALEDLITEIERGEHLRGASDGG